MFDPVYSKRIALLDDPRSTLGAALLYLGYSPNTTNTYELDKAARFLKERKGEIAEYAPDTGQDLLAEGKVDLAFEYSGDIFQLMDTNEDIRYVIPIEGSIMWVDNLCIPSGARHKDAAEKFLNYILDAKVGAMLSNYVRYGSPNRSSLPLINPDDRNNPAIYPSPDVRRKLFFMADLGSDVTNLYNQVWSDILADFSQ